MKETMKTEAITKIGAWTIKHIPDKMQDTIKLGIKNLLIDLEKPLVMFFPKKTTP